MERGTGRGRERARKGGRERVSCCLHLILHILPRSTMSCSFGHSRALLRGRRSRREDGRLDHLSMCCSCATSMGLALAASNKSDVAFECVQSFSH